MKISIVCTALVNHDNSIGDLSRFWLFCLGVSVSQMTGDMFRFSYSQPGPFLKRNTTGATCGAGTVYPSGGPEFTLGFKWSSYCRGCDRMVVEFTTTCTINAYHH
jgi:hypothetical protein